MANGQFPDRDPQASWGEVFTIIRVTFELLALPFAMLVISLTLLIATFAALFTEPILVVIPLSLMALGIWYIVRRDRRQQEELQRMIDAGHDVRSQPGRGNLFH